MSLVQFYIASEISRDIVSVLGDLGTVQLRDLNSNVNTFQRSFVKEIRKLTATEEQLDYLVSQIYQQKPGTIIPEYDGIGAIHSSSLGQPSTASSSEVDDLTTKVQQYEANVRRLAESLEQSKQQELRLIEHRLVLNGSRKFFGSHTHSFDIGNDPETLNNVRLSLDSADGLLMEEESVNMGRNLMIERDFTMISTMNYITGTIDSQRYHTLEKILWRVLRGNLYLSFVPIDSTFDDTRSGQKVNKYIFLVFTHGDNLINKTKRIVDSLGGIVFHVESNYELFKRELDEINSKLFDLKQVIDHTQNVLNSELLYVCQDISQWQVEIKKEKAIYNALNQFNYDQTRRCLIGEGWIPKHDLPAVKNALRDVTERSGSDINSVVNELYTNRTPPTFHRTNKFTAAFQSIIDAYGIATYQEVNPGLASVVTFPFLFAIMFGDVGHGFLVFLAALVLILKENKIAKMKRDEIFDMAFTGRYILILMGAFSVYTGFIYNDIFSRSLTLFKSGWKWPSDFDAGQSVEATERGTYAFGIDYAWHGTDNNLLFTNSYKMKLSILIGFCHMSYSFFFSLVNYKYFKSNVDVIGNFIPGLLFMQGIFGYLSLTIVYKWCVDWVKIGKPAPGLLNMLINMFLSPGTVEEQLYPGQSVVQIILVLIALVCVPWLLLYKPLVLRRRNNQSIQLRYSDLFEHDHINQLSDSENLEDDDFFVIQDIDDEQELFNFGDVMIHQVIHTIEFCLNCVSHTASYLRLWALSLAHNQLSAVLWSMTIANSFGTTGYSGIFMTFFLFGLWFILTVAILVVMEGTSAMLHSLRLHWVEAMSKFFEGEGYAYTPFSFVDLLKESDNQ
ncbi:hypothetical protein LJB42_000683 [Komagataella kurtzmanii]|nr:hypothetical protein LJB42_000683 [Komagataella kurtzmanii]